VYRNNNFFINQSFQCKLIGGITLFWENGTELMQGKSIFAVSQQVVYPIFHIFILSRIFQESKLLRKVVKKDAFCKKSLLNFGIVIRKCFSLDLEHIGDVNEMIQSILALGFAVSFYFSTRIVAKNATTTNPHQLLPFLLNAPS